MKPKMTIIFTEDEDESGIYNVSVPELPGLYTWGTGIKEALKMAVEAIELYLDFLSDHK